MYEGKLECGVEGECEIECFAIVIGIYGYEYV